MVTGVEAGVDKPDDGKDDGGDKPATGSALPGGGGRTDGSGSGCAAAESEKGLTDGLAGASRRGRRKSRAAVSGGPKKGGAENEEQETGVHGDCGGGRRCHGDNAVSAKTVVGNMLPEEEWSSEST